ncbi:hypothetical protein KM043_018585 [Ampulex compressa]|uniref:Venom protein n=1 Tax=Ampulex compressa TaxID=860918 RepID=A0A1W6EVV6_AMPCP|nr:venom protein [Ampulex compressa]KAG7202250.1 hypothetical protein KM043_018585 [Ampulex compressa]
MKTGVVLYFAVAICGFALTNAGDSEKLDLDGALMDMKAKVANIMTFNVVQLTQVRSFVAYAGAVARVHLDTMISSATNNTRTAAHKFKSEGKNVDYCVQRVIIELEKKKLEIDSEFTWCTHASQDRLFNSFAISTKILNEGYRIIAMIKMILSICHGQLFGVHDCITRRGKRMKEYIKCFEEKDAWYPKYRKMVSAEISHNIGVCLSRETADAAAKIAFAKRMGEKCLDQAT